MTVKRIARRLRHRSTFATVAITLFATIAFGLYSLLPTAPLWMTAAVASFPALLITDAGMALADRCGWLPEIARAQATSTHDDINRAIPQWLPVVESIVGGGLIGWFGQSLYDHWRQVYPTTPGWMLYMTVVALWGLAYAGVEEVTVQGFKLLHRRSDTRSKRHS